MKFSPNGDWLASSCKLLVIMVILVFLGTDFFVSQVVINNYKTYVSTFLSLIVLYKILCKNLTCLISEIFSADYMYNIMLLVIDLCWEIL